MKSRRISTTISEDLFKQAKLLGYSWKTFLAKGIVSFTKKDQENPKKIEHLEKNIAKMQRLIRRLSEKIYKLEEKQVIG